MDWVKTIDITFMYIPCHTTTTVAAYHVAIVVKRKSWKAMMDTGQNRRGGIFLFLGLIVSSI